MIDGKTSKAFSGESLKPNNISISNLTEEIIKVNQLARGTPRILVEEQIKQALA
jgi:hypothetical protein